MKDKIEIKLELTEEEARLLADIVPRISSQYFHDAEGLRAKIRRALREAGVACV